MIGEEKASEAAKIVQKKRTDQNGMPVGAGPADLVTYRWDEDSAVGEMAITNTVARGQLVFSAE